MMIVFDIHVATIFCRNSSKLTLTSDINNTRKGNMLQNIVTEIKTLYWRIYFHSELFYFVCLFI